MKAITSIVRMLYLSSFLVFFRIGQGWTQSLNEAKGIAGVSALQVFVVITAVAWARGTARGITPLIMAIMAGSIGLLNGYYLITRGHGLRFDAAFRKLARRKKVLTILCGVTTIIAMFSITMFLASVV